MHRGFLKTAAFLGALSVMLGAFGAHALKSMVSDRSVQTFETAVRYQFYHVFALALCGILYAQFKPALVAWAGYCFISGVIFFSGSLYVLSLLQAAVKPGYNWVGAITPLGGVFFIAGWLLLALAFFKKK